MALKTPLLGGNQDPRQGGIDKAAWMLENATHDIIMPHYPEDHNGRHMHIQVLKADSLANRAILCLVILTIFELPTWCRTEDNWWNYMAPDDRCKSPDGSTLYLSGVPYVPIGVGVVIELLLLSVVWRKCMMDRKLEQTYFVPLRKDEKAKELGAAKDRRIQIGCIMCILAVVDIVQFTYFSHTSTPMFRFNFVARTGLLCLLPAVRELGGCVYGVLREFFMVATFLGAAMIFFAWIAVTIFDDITTLDDDGNPVNVGLNTPTAALYTMFVAGTTDDFVDMFLPSFTAFRVAGLLWLVFLVLVQLLFLNLVLDTLVAKYQTYSETKSEEKVECQVDGLKESFQTLSKATGEEEITKETFIDFCTSVGQSPRMPPITNQTADLMFTAMDEDGSGLMEESEFVDICGMFAYKFWSTPRDSCMKSVLPWESGWVVWFREVVWAGGFDDFMNAILGLNFVLVIVESVYDLHDWDEPPSMAQADFVFSLAYVGEVACKLSVFSFKYYWSQGGNQFDFWTTWLLLGCNLLQGVLSRYANLLRLLRLLRVLKQLKQFKKVQFMIGVINQLVKRSKDILTLLAVVMYFFTALGVQAFGGLLYDGSKALKGSEYLESKWAVFNFNDFIMSFSLWFVMLLCEYVPNFADAIWRTSAIPLSWLVFVVFYIAAVSIVFELVKAFTIEVFIELTKEGEGEEEEGGLEKLEESALFKELEKEFEERGEYLFCVAVGDTSKRSKLREEYQKSLHGHGCEGHHHGGHGGHGGHEAHGGHGGHEGHGGHGGH